MSDRNERLDQLLQNAAAEIDAHWQRCREAELDAHTKAATDSVDGEVRSYFGRLKALPDPADEAEVLAEMQRLYERLAEINDNADGELLETDERELLVPLFVAAAEVCGVNSDDHDGEPGGEFREF